MLVAFCLALTLTLTLTFTLTLTLTRRVLVAFCLIAMLLEASMSAGVVATFQPLAVSRFGWGSDQIAAVSFLSSSLLALPP